MINGVKLPQHFADYGITPRRIVLVNEDNVMSAYFLFKIPKVNDSYLGTRQIDGGQVGKLIAKSELEKAVTGSSKHQNNALRPSSALMDGEQPLTPEIIQKLVYQAHGLHPPEPYDFANHPFPSTLDSEISGF